MKKKRTVQYYFSKYASAKGITLSPEGKADVGAACFEIARALLTKHVENEAMLEAASHLVAAMACHTLGEHYALPRLSGEGIMTLFDRMGHIKTLLVEIGLHAERGEEYATAPSYLENLQAYAESRGVDEQFEGPDALKKTALQLAHLELQDIPDQAERERLAAIAATIAEMYLGSWDYRAFAVAQRLARIARGI